MAHLIQRMHPFLFISKRKEEVKPGLGRSVPLTCVPSGPGTGRSIRAGAEAGLAGTGAGMEDCPDVRP